MAATYLPLLLSSVTVTASDDCDIANSTSTSQVDYLSHQWREEDVWRSWRSMTRQKNEIANGTRLENASWRTWWKQRNGLQTVSPETLNWLKDSDVTWLYGPLHTAEAHQPRLNRSASTIMHHPARSSTPPPTPSNYANVLLKPILKHRTLADLLVYALPPPGSGTGLVDVSALGSRSAADNSDMESLPDLPAPNDKVAPTSDTRPTLLHTQSETNILHKSPFRKASPPRIIADDYTNQSLSHESFSRPTFSETHSGIPPPESASTPPPGESGTNPRKHISFNTFVEQCIAIEKPQPEEGSFSGSKLGHELRISQTSLDQTGPYDHLHYSGTPKHSRRVMWSSERQPESPNGMVNDSDEEDEDDDDEDDDDDDRIEIRPRSRSSSLSGPRPTLSGLRGNSSALSVGQDPSQNSPVVSPQGTGSREHYTIAPIAPTLLKTSSYSHSPSPTVSSVSLPTSRSRNTVYCKPYVAQRPLGPTSGDDLHGDGLEDEDGEVPLLWVPPVGSGYEREFTLQEYDEPGFGFGGGKHVGLAEARRVDGYGVGNWMVTPPVEDSLVEVHEPDYFSQQRKGRAQDRNLTRQGDGRVHLKANESLSPAETSSSNDSSTSRSRSRSRNRNEMLNLSPDSRGATSSRGRPHSRSSHSRSRSRSRSISSARDEDLPSDGTRSLSRSPPVEFEDRGRSLGRGASDYTGGEDVLDARASRTTTRRSILHSGAKPQWIPKDSNRVAGQAPSPSAMPDANAEESTGGALAGIRGYIGSMWNA